METYFTTTLSTEIWDVKVSCDFIWENDGIGPYEFWGQKCCDHGQNYMVIEQITPIWTDETEAERAEILAYIDANFDKCAEQCEDMYSRENN